MAPEPVLILNVKVNGGPGADPDESADLARGLRRLMLEREIPQVEFARSGELPPGAKGDGVALTTIAVTLAPIALRGVIDMLQSWLTRHERAVVTVETGEAKLTITGTPSPQQQQSVVAFLDRHKA